MLLLLVARHGARADDAPAWAPPPECPRWDPPLSPAGAAQADALGAAAAAAGVTRVVTSPFWRCLETAGRVVAAVARASGAAPSLAVDCRVCEALTVANVGDDLPVDPATWPWRGGGGPAGAARAAGLPPATRVVGALPPSYPEPLAAARARYAAALVAIAAEGVGAGEGGATLVVTHGEAVGRAVALADPAAVVVAVAPCGVAAFRVGGDDGCEWGEAGGWAGIEVSVQANVP